MGKVDQIIEELQVKIKQMVEENKKLKTQVTELNDESSYYRSLAEEKEEAVRSLESKSQLTAAARNVEQKSDSEKAKVKIDALVREIDRCINLLSR